MTNTKQVTARDYETLGMILLTVAGFENGAKNPVYATFGDFNFRIRREIDGEYRCGIFIKDMSYYHGDVNGALEYLRAEFFDILEDVYLGR